MIRAHHRNLGDPEGLSHRGRTATRPGELTDPVGHRKDDRGTGQIPEGRKGSDDEPSTVAGPGPTQEEIPQDRGSGAVRGHHRARRDRERRSGPPGRQRQGLDRILGAAAGSARGHAGAHRPPVATRHLRGADGTTRSSGSRGVRDRALRRQRRRDRDGTIFRGLPDQPGGRARRRRARGREAGQPGRRCGPAGRRGHHPRIPRA